MANTKSLRLEVGSIFPKGPGKIYFYRYQVDGRRKTVSLQTAKRAEALKKSQELTPIVKASTPEIVAAHVEYAKGFKEAERNLCVSDIWDLSSTIKYNFSNRNVKRCRFFSPDAHHIFLEGAIHAFCGIKP